MRDAKAGRSLPITRGDAVGTFIAELAPATLGAQYQHAAPPEYCLLFPFLPSAPWLTKTQAPTRKETS